jgi:hypothetical protein
MTKNIETAVAWVDGAFSQLQWSPPEDIAPSWSNLVARLADLDSSLPVSFYDEAVVAENANVMTFRRPELPQAEGAAATAMAALFYDFVRARRGAHAYKLFQEALGDFETHLDGVLAECPHYHGELREWFLD